MALPFAALAPALSKLADTVLTRVLPPEKMSEKNRQELLNAFKLELLNAEDKTLQTHMSAILAEAQSRDKWTSRARPSFLYVMYIMVLAAIPMGALHAYDPVVASSISDGMKAWLAAIPEPLWWLFGSGYLGYAAVRSGDKIWGKKS